LWFGFGSISITEKLTGVLIKAHGEGIVYMEEPAALMLMYSIPFLLPAAKEDQVNCIGAIRVNSFDLF